MFRRRAHQSLRSADVISLCPGTVGIFFALYLYGTSVPYEYLGVVFIQMTKPVAGPVTFILMILFKLEKFSPLKAAAVVLIFSSVSIEASRESSVPRGVSACLVCESRHGNVMWHTRRIAALNSTGDEETQPSRPSNAEPSRAEPIEAQASGGAMWWRIQV